MRNGVALLEPGGKSAWLFGPGSGNQAQAPATGLRIQSSVLGKPRPIICGRVRLAGNLVWYGDLKSFAQTAGGKGLGGGGKGSTTGFLYTVARVTAICEGPILSVDLVYDQNGNKHPNLGDYNISIKLGGYDQVPFGYLATMHPAQALAFRGLALDGSFPMSLGSNAILPNLNYVALSTISGAYAGVDDADPAAWITDYLTNENYGAGFPAGALGALTALSDWAIATGMTVSDAVVERRDAKSYLDDLIQALASEFVWDGATLDVVPYGDVILSGNGRTFTPAVTPLHTFTDDDFLPNPGGASIGVSSYSGNAPLVGARSRTSDELNQILCEYLDRGNDYNPTPVDNAKNEAAIQLYGARPSSTYTWHFFASQAAAVTAAHLQLGREKAKRNLLTWTAGQRFIRFEPMDVVALQDPKFHSGDAFPVRLTEITENQQDRSLTFVAEEYLQGTGTPYGYNHQSQCCGVSRTDVSADPGATVFGYWDASLCAVPDGPAVILAAAGSNFSVSPRPGSKGLISVWYHPDYFASNPTASGSQIIFESVPGDPITHASFLLGATFHGASAHVQIGLTITATPEGGSPVTLSELVDAGAQASIPAGGFGIIASWDFTGTSWVLKVRLNAGTPGVSTNVEGAAMAAEFPLFQSPTLGNYVVGSGGSTGGMAWSHLWIGLDDEIDGLDAAADGTWTRFFCDTGANASAPIDLAYDGSAPTGGCPPSFYFEPTPPADQLWTAARVNIFGASITSLEQFCIVAGVEFRSVAGGPSRCVGGFASASTTYIYAPDPPPAFDPGNAFDNNPSTYWASANVAGPSPPLLPQQLIYQFAAPTPLAEAAIMTIAGGFLPGTPYGLDSINAWTYEATVDGSTWIQLGSCDPNPFGNPVPAGVWHTTILLGPPGNSTGCIAGLLLPNVTGAGSFAGVGAGVIPACGAYQAIGVRFGADYRISGPQPSGGVQQTWGSANVWVSTDGGADYGSAPVGVIPGPSAIGVLTATYPSHADPDTTDTLSVDLTKSLGALRAFSSADADAGRSRVLVDSEIIDYSAADLTAAYQYDLDTYIRRGQLGTAPASHSAGAPFTQLGSNALTLHYPPSMIGATIHVKLQGVNTAGGGVQDLAALPDHAITLAGPGDPAAPASLTAAQSAAGAPVILGWPGSTGCGVTSYVLQYDSGGPTTTVELGDVLSMVLALSPATYNFAIFAVNAAGLMSAAPATATLAVI